MSVLAAKFRSRFAVLLLAICLPPSSVVWADEPLAPQPVAQYDLRLHDAVVRDDQQVKSLSPLLIVLRESGDGWMTSYATARDYNITVHTVEVTKSERPDSGWDLALNVQLHGDARGTGERFATYAISLEESDRSFIGTHRGNCDGVEVEGRATAVKLPDPKPIPEGFLQPDRDEYPRILFRKSDLPALRKRAATPFGKAALAKMNDPVGLGVRYQLTEDKKLALEVIPALEKMIERGLVSDQYGNNVGVRLETVALCYDLCRDAWPEGFRKRAEFYLLWAGRGVLRARRDTHQGVNWHVCSNWSAPLYTGAAVAGMALVGHEGPKPEKPTASQGGARIDPANGYKPGEGVHMADFTSDEMPTEWIYCGGFKTDFVKGDPLAKLGGTVAARPQSGSKANLGDHTDTFRPLSHEKDKGYWAHDNYHGGKTVIDITNAVEREYFSTNYFYTVIRNDKPRWVRFDAGTRGPIAYLNGVRLQDGEVARLDGKGLYPFLVEVYIDQTNPWGRQMMRPRLSEIPESEAQGAIEKQKTAEGIAIEDWQRRVSLWRSSGKEDLRYRDLFERSRHMMYMFNREAVGDGGAQAELTHYSTIAEKAPARYAGLHRRMFGYNLSPQKDIELLVPRKVFSHIYGKGEGARAIEINGSPQIDSSLFASLWPVVPNDMRGAVLWAWHRHTGIGEDDYVSLLQKDPVHAFLNYPLDGKPVHPSQQMPLTWRADDFGYYGFRNHWKDENDALLQVWAKAHYVGGWNARNAGTFRLQALGHTWAGGSTDRNRHRWEESVVQLPDNPEINLGACGLVKDVEIRKKGSGGVTINFDDVYASAKTYVDRRGRTRRERLYSRYGNIRNEEALQDARIDGYRSIAVDYSGKSGAPVLLAMSDIIDGGGRKVWTWQLEPGVPRKGNRPAEPGDVDRTTVKGSTVTIRKPDGATLRGVFITGQKPVAEIRQTTMKGGGGSTKGKTLQRPINGIFAESAKETDVFFFVATIQEGDPPPIKVEGRGFNARVRIGKAVVRYDDTRIIID